MKKELILLASMAFWGIHAQAQTPMGHPDISDIPSQPPVPEYPENHVYIAVQQKPEFTGGSKALEKFLKDNLVYPETAKQKDIEGKVYVKFIVEKDGTFSNIEIAKGMFQCPECGVEALRVVKAMPKWKAGKENGNAVRVMFALPIQFRLSK